MLKEQETPGPTAGSVTSISRVIDLQMRTLLSEVKFYTRLVRQGKGNEGTRKFNLTQRNEYHAEIMRRRSARR